MKEVLEKILTDKATRSTEKVEAFASAQSEFGSWG